METRTVPSSHEPPDAPSDETCRNCGAAHLGPYCHACGQHFLEGRFTLRTLWREFVERFFRLERGLWPTISGMTTHPGRLIRAYVDGRRRRYVNPFTYLFFGTAVSIITGRLAGVDDFNPLDIAATTPTNVDVVMQSQMADAFAVVMEAYFAYSNVIALTQCAVFALLLRAFFRKGRLNIAQAAVFALFVYGHVALLLGVLQLPLALLEGETLAAVYSLVSMLTVGAYLLLSLFGAIGYFGAHAGPILKTIVAQGLTYGLTIFVTIAAWIVVLVSTGDAARPDVSLHGAVESGERRLVETLLADSADVNALRTEAPLHTAVRHGHADLAALLLARGADPAVRDAEGWTPLLLALHLEHEAVAEALLEGGASVADSLADGTRAVHEAAEHGADLLRLVLPYAPDVNAVRRHERPAPLMSAVHADSDERTCLLLRAGADPALAAPDGRTARDFAKPMADRSPLERILEDALDYDVATLLDDPAGCDDVLDDD